MFLSVHFLRIKKIIAKLLLVFLTVSFILNHPAIADSATFSSGKQTGQNALNSMKHSIESGVTLPSFGTSSNSNLGSFYPGDGKDGPSVVNNLMSAGSDVKRENCLENDSACKARQYAVEKYGSQHNNPYQGTALDMRSNAQQVNPEELLGLNNLPTEGPVQLCSQTTTTLPSSSEEKKCLDATIQQTVVFTKLPTTIGHDYTSPICIDPDYELSNDGRTCGKTWYSCPNGGYYDGVECRKEQDYVNLGGTIFGVCLTCPEGYVPDPTGQADCVDSYPATQHYDEVSAGCLGGPTYSAGQLIQSEERLIQDPRTNNGTYTCESETYSCPEGMAMNGSICEEVNRMQYESNPNCVNLGYVPEERAEGYLCVIQELRECDTIPEDCTQTDEECLWIDQITGSPTEGQCIANEKTFSCPVPGETITQEQCSYQPMCIDGNCFTPENKCSPIDVPDTTKTYSESCQVLTEEKIQSCENSFLYSEPDEDGDRHIIEAGPYDYSKVWNEQTKQYDVVRTPKASCEWFNHDNCLLAPTRMEVDSDGNATWPQNSYFSCLGDTLDLCASEPDFEYQIDPATGEYALDEDGKPIASIAPDAKPGLDSDPECTLTGQEVTQYSIADESIPIATIKKYSCERQLTLPTDTCTDDFAKMAVAMEASREGGEYFDPDTTKIFKGEFHRCDRRSANWGGAGYGSKSCCNISAPDPQTNSDIMEDAKQSIAMDAVGSIAKYAVTTGSSYMYDWMMKSQTFADTAQKLSGYATKISQLFETTEQASNAASATENASNLSNMTVGVSYAGIGISYGAGVAVGTSTTTAMGTTMYGLGGNMALTFNPYMFAIVVAIKMFEAYQAALACDQTDYETATLKKAKLCYSYGSWCERESSGIFGSTCEIYRTGHCCYNSVLARLINEQGRQQLGLPMEVCDGFTVNEIQQLDWNEIDLSEFISIMLEKAQESIPTADDMERLKAKFSSNAGVSASTNKQPIDQTFVDGERKPHH